MKEKAHPMGNRVGRSHPGSRGKLLACQGKLTGKPDWYESGMRKGNARRRSGLQYATVPSPGADGGREAAGGCKMVRNLTAAPALCLLACQSREAECR